METEEIDSTLDELENRLDRLRALYEQYFLGIEKIEPAVARKDVDRRFWVLRRTQIRNTARRFRLQVLVQRYNTFQQYWTRICREIENGTYARHLLKAQKNLGAEPKTWAAKKRLGLLRRGGVLAPNGAAVAANGASDSEAPQDGGADGAGEVPSPPPAAAGSSERPPARAEARRSVAVTLTLDDLGPLDLDFDDEPAPLPRRPPAPASPARPPLPPRKASPAPAASLPVAPKPAATRQGAPGFVAPTVATPAALVPAAAKPAAPPAPAAARPAAPLAPPAPAPAGLAATAPSTALSEERVKKLYSELVETKRKLNQTNTVSVDALAKSLRDTETKLRAAHGGRTIDFQIVVKDGKPVVKPVVRK